MASVKRSEVISLINHLIAEMAIKSSELTFSNSVKEASEVPVKATTKSVPEVSSKFSEEELEKINSRYVGRDIIMTDGRIGHIKSFNPERGVFSVVTGPHRPTLMKYKEEVSRVRDAKNPKKFVIRQVA